MIQETKGSIHKFIAVLKFNLRMTLIVQYLPHQELKRK